MITNAGVDLKERKILFSVDGDRKWHYHYGNQCGGAP